MASRRMTVGFVGLGNMGSRMAANLLRKGCRVVAYDTQQGAMGRLRDAGAQTVESPALVSRVLAEQTESGVLISMLPGNAQVRDAYWLADDSILSSVAAGTRLIDCSTIAPAIAREIAAKAEAAGCEFVDAPVSGGVVGAEAATLTFMVGAATADAVERARPVLELMGQRVLHCGDVGSGQAAKLSNNLVLAVSMIGVAEGMLLGERLGVDKKVLASIFNSSSARCWSSDTYNPCPGVMDNVPAARDYQGGFAVNLMRKDLGLALDAATASETALRAARMALSTYDEAAATGLGDKDFSAVYRLLEEAKIEPPVK
mmetsp:Transcript_19672/g.38298  ORF Transcript_19672/g.38298 Transcript_19672/m.38298 type:complete len:315 (-) Transcript_19672:234-1178(-)